MELKGIVKSVGEGYQRGNLFLRDLIIETKETYKQTIKIEFLGDKCDLLDGLTLFDDITVFVNIKGREWQDPRTLETKYFNSIQGWKINKNLEL